MNTYLWDTTWASDPLITAQSVASGSMLIGTRVPNAGKISTQVSVTMQYTFLPGSQRSPVTQGIQAGVYFATLDDVDGTSPETFYFGSMDFDTNSRETLIGDAAAIQLGQPIRKVFLVGAGDASAFYPAIINQSGIPVTVTVRSKQSS